MKRTKEKETFAEMASSCAGGENQRKRKRITTGRPRSPEISRKQRSTIEGAMLQPMTRESLRVSAASEDVERYRALLRADWSRATLDALFSFLSKLLAK